MNVPPPPEPREPGAEERRLAEDAARSATGSAGAPTSPSGSGARCARTTRRTATRWDYFPHDHARSRAYRWGEDGLLGICDRECRLCFALALWNGTRPDPEGAALRPHRPRGQPRRGREGGVLLPRLDADALLHEGALQVSAGRVPLRAARRREPPARARRARVRARRHGRLRRRPLLRRLRRVREGLARTTCSSGSPSPTAGRDAATLHVLPTLWFRNTWSWGRSGEGYGARSRRSRCDGRRRVLAEHATLGRLRLVAGPGPGGAAPELLFTENETNRERLFGVAERRART